jgi:hypothetical protein
VDNTLGLFCALTPHQLLATLFAAPPKGGMDDSGGGGFMALCGSCICPLIIVIPFVIAAWKIFSKAGRPGWESLVPIYSHWVLVKEICKLEPLWFFLGFVPIANIVAAWKICQELAKKFGKSDMFGIGLFFLGPIFALMLAFGDAKYIGNKKKRYDDEDEEEEAEEEEEEDRPRRNRRDDDDEGEERPRKRRRDDDD